MVYGYARVSSASQSLEVQRKELMLHGCNIIMAEKITGTVTDRPELNRLLELVKPGDKVIVVKLDRIARSAKGGIEIIDRFIDKGVTLEILNMGRFDNTPSGKLLRTIMLAFSEFERDMIVERCSEGKELARAKGELKEGRPPLDDDIKEAVIRGERFEDLGISRRSWFKIRSEARERGLSVSDRINPKG